MYLSVIICAKFFFRLGKEKSPWLGYAVDCNCDNYCTTIATKCATESTVHYTRTFTGLVYRSRFDNRHNDNTICRAKPNVSPPGCATSRLRPASPMHYCKNWLPWQRPLRGRKTDFRLIVCSHGSTNPQNLAKIRPVDFEIIGLTLIVKNK